MSINVQLLVVDPQNDFCVGDDGHGNQGALVVPGADEDMKRLAAMVDRLGKKLTDIHVTLDSHRLIDISHPRWWKRVGDGSPPDPFTILGMDDGKVAALDSANWMAPTSSEFTTYVPSFLNRSRQYLAALATDGRYPHCIWPPHCLIGSWGHNVMSELFTALQKWEDTEFAMTDYVTKGSNPWTEHFSGVKAEVPDPTDPDSQINTRLIQTLEEADIVVIAGEALSHCVANTVRDIVDCFSDPKYIEKLTLLTDASSSVAGFESLGDEFLKDMEGRGMKTSTTTDFLS
jgi:nicotinamidase-related amidase